MSTLGRFSLFLLILNYFELNYAQPLFEIDGEMGDDCILF